MIYHGFDKILNNEERYSIAFNIKEKPGVGFEIEKNINDRR